MGFGAEEESGLVIRGTLNVVLANRAGFVVVTDSMQTARSATGEHQLPEPGKKLFQLDGRTVCTIAGFGSAPVPPAPEFNTSAAGILERYRGELARQHEPQSIVEKLTSLSFLFNFYLSSVANIRDVVQGDTLPDRYEFQLLLAGYDRDGTPKIGVLSLRTVLSLGADRQLIFSSVAEGFSEVTVGNELVYRLAGQPDVALEILRNPHNFENDVAIRRYAESIASDGGSSLTLEELKQLGEALVRHTEERYPSVGGPRQIAVLRNGEVESIEQPNFPEHPLPMPGFNLVVGGHFEGPRSIVFQNAIALFVRNHFRGDVRTLDGHYFFGNEFVESQLRYDGGSTRFDRSNQVVGSVLVIGAHANQESDTVRRLANDFPWRAVCYERQ
jgi:20S proteasome alpha/beta subunit